MERKHAIIIIKNLNNEYLQYYDERWTSYLFLNCKIEDKFDIEKVKIEVNQKLNVNKIAVSYIMDKIHTKFSGKLVVLQISSISNLFLLYSHFLEVQNLDLICNLIILFFVLYPC